MLPGCLFALITFPGVIVHEIAHLLCCRVARVAVFEVCFFRIGTSGGHLVHERPRSPYQSILIGVGPFLVNSLLGPLIAFPAIIPCLMGTLSATDAAMLWLGLSIAAHAFPSMEDGDAVWAAVFSRATPLPARILTVPLVGVIYIGTLGAGVGLDVFYAVTIVMFLPYLLLTWLG